MIEAELTAVQQDYLEVIHALAQRRLTEPASEGNRPAGADESPGVRVTDVAAELGTQPPTVVRTVARLKAAGLVQQEERGLIRLTPAGAQLGAQLAHRHADVVAFLAHVLGVDAARAEAEACLVEHGLSGETAQRLHLFMERWQTLPTAEKDELRGPRTRVRPTQFTLLGDASGQGGRQ